MRGLWTVLLLALSMWACDDGPTAGSSTVDVGGGGGSAIDDGVGGSGGSAGDGGISNDQGMGGMPAEEGARTPGRMTIEQLARSIPVVTGGIRWIEDFGTGPADMLMILAPTLGAPDYRRITEENLEPTLIVAKFVQDASFRICGEWVRADASAAVEDRTLVSHGEDWQTREEAAVKANLRALQLRFYARRIQPDDEAAIADLYELFTNAANTAPENRATQDGWLAVCVAMMTDPEFILY